MNRDVSIREVMDREFLAASESDRIPETVEMMLREEREPVVVLRGSDPVGVLTDRDVLALLVANGEGPAAATVGDVMTESVPTVAPDETVAAARDQMASRSIGWLVVSDGGEPLGVITEHDVLTSSTLGTEVGAAEAPRESDEQVVSAGDNVAAAGGKRAAEGGFEHQGICELCGSLSRDLSAFNGQLRCTDCRDI